MKGILSLAKDIVGPTAVMAAGTMGAGAVASLILAGAWFQYDLLWVVVLMLPLFVVSVDSASRVGSLNPDRGMFSLIRSDVSPVVAWVLLIINVPVHVLIIMGQMSVMTSSLMAMFGVYPPGTEATAQYSQAYDWAEMLLPIVCAMAIMWLVLAQGYERMQKVMTVMMVAMAGCFFMIALRGFSEIPQIIAGFVPAIPPDLPIPETQSSRQSSSSIIAIVGSAIAPAALLGMSYLSSDAHADATTLRRDFKKSILNLGVIFGAYAMFIIIAGGYALYPLENHAQIDAVHEASRVLVRAFPDSLAFAGPAIFAAGVLIAAVTTIVLAAQLSTYFCLDMLGKPWRFTADNRPYRYFLVMFLIVPAVLAPFWDFPALLKVVLLMGVNVIVIPLVIVIVIYMVNRQKIVGEHRAEWWRTLILVAGLVVSLALAANKLPDYIQFLTG